jgi:hypothetical protein
MAFTALLVSSSIFVKPRRTCSKHRVARLMRQANLRALHGYRIRR